MAEKIRYPVYRWNKEGGVATCDNDQQVRDNEAKGFILKSNPGCEYPRALYDKDGRTALAVDRADEEKKKAQGFGRDHVPAPEQKHQPGLAVSASEPMDSTTLRAIFEEIGELRQRVELLEAGPEPADVAAKGKKLKTEPAA